MAKIIPPLNTIKKNKQQPTEGELYLLNYFEKRFASDIEVYFQPYFNSQRPDIILIHKIKGIIIIEVKDWNLDYYYVDEYNKWHLRRDGTAIHSPTQQVFDYKNSMYELHINGLQEKLLSNKNFYKVIQCFVYFHNANKQNLDNLYDTHIKNYSTKFKETSSNSSDGSSLSPIKYRLERDKNISVTPDTLKKIKFPLNTETAIYPPEVYDCFMRYLNPPFHYRNMGGFLALTTLQQKLSISEASKMQKITGAAGSGKTTILASRAVNAHKRHGGRVLILTYNITLRMYIKDRLSEVREDFSWGAFAIINYHRFIKEALNACAIPIEPSDSIEKLEKLYYDNETLFKELQIEEKYATILIDEVQDYKPQWIKIIRDNFLTLDGEMVLFGDEKQNVYRRELHTDKTSKVVKGFGKWEKLTKSFRQGHTTSPLITLALEFQRCFFTGRYGIDSLEAPKMQLSFTEVEIYQCVIYNTDDFFKVTEYIYNVARQHNIHPNDIVILASKLPLLQEIDRLIRKNIEFNEKTLTTFESQEMYRSLPLWDVDKLRSSKKYGFNLNSGVLKLATVHSFKGYEAPTVFLFVDSKDSEELVYTGITRAMFNLVVFIDKASKYYSFFKQHLQAIDLTT